MTNMPQITKDYIRTLNLNDEIATDDIANLIIAQIDFMIDDLQSNSIRTVEQKKSLDTDIVFIKRFFEKIEKGII